MNAQASAPAVTASLRARLLFAFLIPTVVVLAVGGFALYRLSRQALEDQLGQSLSDVAASISSSVKAERVLALTPEDAQGEGSRTFRSLTAQVQEARVAAGLKRVLIFDKNRLTLLDVSGGLPIGAEVPETLRDSLELSRVWKGEKAASQVLFTGTDGQFYKTGYAPLKNENDIVAIVAVEGTAAFFGPLQALRNALLALSMITLLMLAIAAIASARTISNPLLRLVDSALLIGRGDLETPVEKQPTREIGTLSTELESMRQALKSRDQQLKMMIGGVAHEVKNPLGGMELFSGLLGEELRSEKPDVSEARSHLDRISRELNYLKRIVDDFLHYAREEKLNTQQLSTDTIVSAVKAHLQSDAVTAGVALESSGPAAQVDVDESLLTGALINLVKNAIQVSKTGQLVTIHSEITGEFVTLQITDAGPGIPAEVQPRIFEPFFTTKEKGTGLGLPLARKIVEAHRGSISMTSQPGKTVFSIRLPLSKTVESTR